jgi:ribonuclease HI
MPWLPHKLRDSDVWAKADARGELAADKDGRVDVVYQPKPGAKVYRASARNLVRREGEAIELELEKPAVTGEAVYVWTDGACTGNPGPAGLGVVVIEDGERRELSEFLGDATNNIAELTAIERGLELVKKRDRPVLVHSDSAYAIGLLSQNWKAKANVELVMRLRELAAEFPDVRYVKVKGHAGVPENERCDQLAREAILRRR